MPPANSTIWDFEGLVTTTYMYLVSRYNDLPIYRDEPPADWDGLTGCVIIKDGGGNQLTADQLLTGRVTLDIRHPDPAIAETSARTVSTLIREWDYLPDPVWVTSAGIPTYDPIDDPATPAWTFTAALTVKSTTTRATAPTQKE